MDIFLLAFDHGFGTITRMHEDNGSISSFIRRVIGTRYSLCSLWIACLIVISGCGTTPDVDQAGAHQSLVEIGERSLELAESLENTGRAGEANASYRRAVWAFTYHEHLTGEEPLLMDEAAEGVRRTSGKKG